MTGSWLKGDALRNAYLCAFGISMLGTGLAYPLTALYLHDALHVPVPQISIYFLTVALAAMVINPIAGTQSDRRGPLPVVGLAVVFQTVGPLVLAFASSLKMALVAAVINGIGNGCFFAVQTPLLVRLFGQPRLGRLYGTQYLIMNLALTVSGIGAGLLVARLGITGYRTAFVANGVSYACYGVIALGVVARRIPAMLSPNSASSTTSRSWYPYRDRAFLPLIFLQLCLVMFGFAQVEAVLPVVLRQAGNFSVPLIAGFLAVNGIAVVIAQPYANRICERVGPRRGLMWAVGCWLVAYAWGFLSIELDGLVAKVLCLAMFAAVFAVGETLISPTLQPLVADRAPAGQLGVYAGAISLTYSVGMIIGPVVALPLFGHLGVAWYWPVLLAGVGACLALLELLDEPAPRVVEVG